MTHAPWREAGRQAWTILRSGGIAIITGPRGTGKTRLALELARDSSSLPGAWHEVPGGYGAKDPSPAIYETAVGLSARLASAYSSAGGQPESATIAELAEASLLVIDEASKRDQGSKLESRLTEILDARHRSGRASILIGNYPDAPSALAAFDPSIARRVATNGGVIVAAWRPFVG